jgi:L-2-hydroxyglutarate oxidase LhgO
MLSPPSPLRKDLPFPRPRARDRNEAMEKLDCVVAGAGVVGLAIARALARAGREVVVAEKAAAIGTETSSRNSEVVHSGIYYERGSMKARLCVRGRELLYAYCAEKDIPHRRIGKLIFAANPQEGEKLRALAARGRDNGVEDLRTLTAEEARRLEPGLSCVSALHSPSTGILDSHALMLALLADAEECGAMAVFDTPVLDGEAREGGVVLRLGGNEPMEASCRTFVNCAGFSAPALARGIAGFPAQRIPRGRLCKGNYFTFAGKTPFSRLIYPVPEEAGLGIHLTFDLAGQARFGPDVEWVEKVDYRVDPSRGESFERAVRNYWPALPPGSLTPGYAGIRSKIAGPGEPAADFLIEGPREHGVAGMVNLFGIESPGLTACLAIAEETASRAAT